MTGSMNDSATEGYVVSTLFQTRERKRKIDQLYGGLDRGAALYEVMHMHDRANDLQPAPWPCVAAFHGFGKLQLRPEAPSGRVPDAMMP